MSNIEFISNEKFSYHIAEYQTVYWKYELISGVYIGLENLPSLILVDI